MAHFDLKMAVKTKVHFKRQKPELSFSIANNPFPPLSSNWPLCFNLDLTFKGLYNILKLEWY